MVKKLAKTFSSPLILSAVICAVLIYTGTVKVSNRNDYKSLAEMQSLCSIKGTVCTTPSVSSDGKFYSAKVKLDEVTSFGNGSDMQKTNKCLFTEKTYSAGGKINVRFNAEQVQSFLPGKLYSVSENCVLLEKGAYVECSGNWSLKNGCFSIQHVEECSFAKNHYFDYIRALFRLLFKRLMFSWGNAGALILSLLSGSRDYLPESVRDAFKNAGLSHILALSGMHLSFFSGLASRETGRFVSRKYVFYFQIAAVLLFVWFAGISPSLFRALFCSLFMLFASKSSCRNTDFLAVLGGVFLIHIMIYPSDATEAAFMLSYGALAGILTIGSFIKKYFFPVLTPYLSESVSASVGAQVFTAPVSIKLFGEFMPVGIIASVIVSPLITWFLTAGLFLIILCVFFPFASGLCGKFLNAFYSVIVFFVEGFAQWPSIKLI